MSSRRKGRLKTLSLFALLLTGMLFAPQADALPEVGSLTIRDVTYDSGADRLDIVFDRTVSAAAATDFRFNDGTTYAGGAPVISGLLGNVVSLTTFSTAPVPGTTTVAIKDSLAAITGLEIITGNATATRDFSFHPIVTGPVIASALYTAGESDLDPTNDVITVEFNTGVTFVPAAHDTLFSMPQLKGTQTIGDDDGDEFLTLIFGADETTVLDYVSTVGLASDILAGMGIQDSNTDEMTSLTRVRVGSGSGAFPLYAPWYADAGGVGGGNDRFYYVMSGDVSFNTPGIGITGITTFSGAGVAPTFSGEVWSTPNRRTVVGVRNAHKDGNYLSAPVLGTSTRPTLPVDADLVNATLTTAADSADSGPAGVPIGFGPAIIAAYWDGNADQIILYFSEGFGTNPVAADFQINGDVATGIGAGWTLATVAGREVRLNAPADTTWLEGDVINIETTPVMVGLSGFVPSFTGAAGTVDNAIPIRDATPPSSNLALTDLLERNPQDTLSHGFISLYENPDLDVCYYLILSKIGEEVNNGDFDTTLNVCGSIPFPNPQGVDGDTATVIIDITPGLNDATGTVIAQGDRVFFGVAPVDKEGNIGQSYRVPGSLVAGPVACPRDFITIADDLRISLGADSIVVTDNNIWINGHADPVPDTLVGDTLAVDPFDIVVVYQDAALTDSIAAGTATDVGSFVIGLPSDAGDANDWIYLTSRDQFGNQCPGFTQILNDQTPPAITKHGDPKNPWAIYGPGDSVCVFVEGADTTAGVAIDQISSLLSGTVEILTFHMPQEIVASASFVAWGSDQTDNDGDWISGAVGDSAVCGPAYRRPADTCRVGTEDYAEPYCDENGNGAFDLGEYFVDYNGNKVFDGGGDFNLDYLDAPYTGDTTNIGGEGPTMRQELAMYKASFANLDAALANPEPVQWLICRVRLLDKNENESILLDTITFDNLAPEQSQFSRLARRDSSQSGAGSGNLLPDIGGTANCYTVGNFVDFDVTTYSDSHDVDYVLLQINTGGGWGDLNFDPNGDLNADGQPGKAGIDDDFDGWADTLDVQVHNAMQNSLAADAADTDSTPAAGDGIWALNDGIDNDNNGVIDDATDTTYAANFMDDDDEDGMLDGTTVSTLDAVIGGGFGPGVNMFPQYLHVAGIAATDTSLNVPGDGFSDETALLFPDIGTPIPLTGTDEVFGWAALNGFNLNMRMIQHHYNIPNETQFSLRAVPYDTRGGRIGPMSKAGGVFDDDIAANRTGNSDPTKAIQICLIVDTTGVACAIDVAAFGENTGADSAAAANIDYTAWDSEDSTYTSPAAPLSYTLTAAGSGAEIDSVVFYAMMWNVDPVDPDTWLGTWTRVGADSDGIPYNTDWTAPIVTNKPCDKTLRYYFYCQAFGASGLFEEALADSDTALAELVVEVVDHVFPITNITSVGNDYDLTNGATVPADSAIHIRIEGTADLDDRDGLAGFSDITSIEFQQRRTNNGNNSAGPWYTIGSIATPFDSMPPVDVVWRTDTLTARDYDVRAIGIDCEGNSNIKFTQVVHVSIDTLGLRAYIEPQVFESSDSITLTAQVFIHDESIDNVDFQVWPDSNENCLPDENISWVSIYNDDNDDSSSADPGGDVTLRVGSGTLYEVSQLTPGDKYVDFDADHGYIDYDGDGYSPIDPVVWDDNSDGFYDESDGDTTVIGQVVSTGTPPAITSFDADEFYADYNTNGDLDDDDWIFKEGLGGFEAGSDEHHTWQGGWNVADLSGSWLIRSVATDELGNVDTDSNTAIPYICCGLDVDAPAAQVCKIAMGLGGFSWYDGMPVDSVVCGDNEWVKLWACLNDSADYADLDYIRFEYSVDNVNWTDLDVNDDNDFYVDIDDTLGFSLGDAIVRDDYSADTTFTVDASDVLLRNGIAGDISDIYGYRMFPLSDEDGAGGGDEDGDGNADEDDFDEEDSRDPYCVYFNIRDLTMNDGLFRTSTRVYFRAVAVDENGNEDTDPTITQFVIQENVDPETDIVWATDENGDTLDVYPATQDGDGGDALYLINQLNLHVTVEDSSTVDSVYVWYRWNPKAYEGLNNLNNPWQRAAVVDVVYPFNLDWDISGLTDGCYQFAVIARDETCNESAPRLNPYEFTKLSVLAEIESALRPLDWTKNGNLDHHSSVTLDTVQVGAELWIRAELSASATAADAANAEVYFWYADRVLGEELTVQTFYPYISSDVAASDSGYSIFGDEDNWWCDVQVHVDTGTADGIATYYTNDDFEALAAPTKFDFTVRGGSKIEFGAQLASTDVAYVSYNYTGWQLIADSPDDDVDENGYFTSAWDPADPVPAPENKGLTCAYDMIAQVQYDFGGDDNCLAETPWSENKIVLLQEIDGPEVTLHGFFWDEDSPFTEYNWSGNPMRQSNGSHRKTKLCGIEYDAFVIVDSVEADSVKLAFDSGTQYDLTNYVTGDTITLTITMNEQDFLWFTNPAIFPDSIENVHLLWDTSGDTQKITMYDDGAHNDGAADDGWWGTQVDVIVGSSLRDYNYQFDIDGSGDEDGVFNDPRVNGSDVQVPADFWHRNFTTELGEGTHTAVASAWGNFGVLGTNTTSAQGPIVFTIDCTPMTVESLNIVQDCDSDDEFQFVAIIRDAGELITDIFEVDEVRFQYATDVHKDRWIDLEDLDYFDRETGWVWEGNWPSSALPASDGIDNNGNGITDEPEEEDYEFCIRVVVADCGWAVTVFPTVPEDVTVRIDRSAPTITMTSPAQGATVTYGEDFTVCAQPDVTGQEIDYYVFYFSDQSGNWIPIDPTPQDDGDDPWVPADGDNEVCVTFDTDWLGNQEDQYVQFLAVAVDNGCNRSDSTQTTPIVAAVNDTIGPAACIISIDLDCDNEISVADPNLRIQGDEVTVVGKVLSDADRVSVVEFWLNDGTTNHLVGFENDLSGNPAALSFTFNANDYIASGTTAEGSIWFLARDLDGNPDPTPLMVPVTWDRVDPSVNYTAVNFVDGTEDYADDDIVDNTSLALKADPFTGLLTFRVTTADADVKYMTLQARPDSAYWGLLGDWEDIDDLDFEPQFDVGGEYLWWLETTPGDIDLDDGPYEWRVLATDFACNTNALDPLVVKATLDTEDPNCLFVGDDAVADGDIGQVAAGDDVELTWFGQDNNGARGRTDIEHVTFWYFGADGDTVIIGTDDTPTPDQLDTPGTKWTANVTWTTPDWLVRDTEWTVYAWAYDTPWNRTTCSFDINIEDRHAPQGTRLVGVSPDEDCNIFPREISETVLNEQTITWTNVIELEAETAVGDSGIARVWFYAINEAGDTLVIDVDENPSSTTDGAQDVWRWYGEWDCEELDHATDTPKWAEGSYTVYAWAVDEEDNVEVPTMWYNFVLDKTAPKAVATINGSTDDTTIERGDSVHVGANVDGNEDVTVTWYMRSHYDSTPGEDAWLAMTVPNGFNFIYETTNPDDNRPYSFDWATWLQDAPLEVGNCYDIVPVAEDLVCNAGDIQSAWAADCGITFCVEDNMAPCATITYLRRELCDEEGNIEQPDRERVRGFASLTAKVLRGDTDTQWVAFQYSIDNGATWVLADNDVDSLGDFSWTLNDWNSDLLPEGDILWRAVAYDDAGNFDESAACSPTRTLVIDRTGPTIEVVTPNDFDQCPFVRNEDGDPVVPLIITSSDDQQQAQFGLVFEWKKTISDTTRWSTSDIEDFLYDEKSGYYTTTWNVDENESGKYDFRVTALDSACNWTTVMMATEVVIDVDAPLVNITRFEIDRNVGGEQTTVVSQISQGLVVDVSAGEPVRIYATATDDEQDIPGPLDQGVDSVYFEVTASLGGTIYHLDLGEQDESDSSHFVAHWNTSALDPGDYFIRARAVDHCGNESYSDWSEVNVIDDSPPRAAVICWEPDVINDINATTKVKVYATEWCNQRVDEVMFQYQRVDASQGDGGTDDGDGAAGKAAAPWVTFGTQTNVATDDSLWCAELEIGRGTIWNIGDEMLLRAVAITLRPEITSKTDASEASASNKGDILYFDANPPYTQVRVVADRFNRDLESVHPEGGAWLSYNDVKVVPNDGLGTNLWVEIAINDSIVDNADWGTIAKPWVLVTADRVVNPAGPDGTEPNFEEIVEMDPMNEGGGLSPYNWGGFSYKGLIDTIGCGGYIYVNAAVVEDSGSATSPARVDIIRHVIAVHEVTNGAGTRGPVAIPGDDNLTVSIPSGNGVYGGLMLTQANTPSASRDENEQAYRLRPFGQAYSLKMLDCAGGFTNDCPEFNDGYDALITWSYDEEDLTVVDAFGDSVTINELTDIYVAHWDGDEWEGGFDADLRVDTENNTVTVNIGSFCYNDDSFQDDAVWSLVGVTAPTQVAFSPWCDGYTNESPVFTATLTDHVGNGYIERMEIFIDNELVASNGDPFDQLEDDNCFTNDDDYIYVLGNGSICAEVVTYQEDQMTIQYTHSTNAADVLDGGPHTLRIQYTSSDDEDNTYNIIQEFSVDNTPVAMEWSGGFLAGPCVGTADCFISGDEDGSHEGITVKLTDLESGVHTQGNNVTATLNIVFGALAELVGNTASLGVLGNFVTVNGVAVLPVAELGLKMDVWLVDDEDDQTDIDEFWERALIQSATPVMLTYEPEICPYSNEANCDDSVHYDPSDDLYVTLPLTVNLKPYDGREIEVVLYSSKVDHIGFDSNLIGIFGDAPEGWNEDDDEEFTRYIFGPFDCVGNVGSQYAARRFIVDSSAPVVTFSTPNQVNPGSDLPIWATIADGTESASGAGVDESTLELTLNGPSGECFSINPATYVVDTSEKASNDSNAVIESIEWDGEMVHAVVSGLEEKGNYTLTLSGRDRTGNSFTATHSFVVGSSVLTITDAAVYPNPVDPSDGDEACINFLLGGTRDAQVQYMIYDFAGDLVYESPVASMAPGQISQCWNGRTNGGTMVANGGYLARILVNDGAGTKAETVKIAIRKGD